MNTYKWCQPICLAAAVLGIVLFSSPSSSGECKNAPYPPGSAALVHSYADKGESQDKYFSIGLNGNEYLALGQEHKPLPPEDLADLIRKNEKFKTAKYIRLDWSFSKRGAAPYANKLEKLLGKPVIGYSGPTWWYPDGVLISSHSDAGSLENLTPENVAECVTADGNYHEAKECKAVLAAHTKMQPIFSNVHFILTCEQLMELTQQSDKGDRGASTKLFNYYAFVDRNAELEKRYYIRAISDIWLSDP